MTQPIPKGPPENVPPSELWTLLSQMPRPWEVVDFPRIDPITREPIGQVAIWVLSQEEQLAASAAADTVAKKILKERQAAGEHNLGYEAVYNNEATVQVLHRACRDVKDLNRSAFPDASKLRKLSVDEVSVLAVLYLQVQAKLGPIIATMSSEEERAWIGRLAEAGNVFPTASLSPREQERLMVSMARQLVSFWTATSSPGSAPESGSTTASESEPVDTLPEAADVPPEQLVPEDA